jgi:hypothetical protein
LPLVFVDALDLAVEDGVRIDDDVRTDPEPVGKPRLARALGFVKVRAERGVGREWPELLQLREIRDPGVAKNRSGNRLGQRRIGELEPAPSA